MKDHLFQPIEINKLEIKNRICMPAMNLNYCQDYFVTERLVDFYSERARGGAGMIVVGCATVDEFSGGRHFIGAHGDEFIPGLHLLAESLRDNGAAAFVQLNHLGRYAFSASIGGRTPFAPSAIASRLTRETPHALTLDEVGQVIEAFAQAAGRVRKAGFDGLEVLCGTGYLISEFLAPLTNQRTDQYGGPVENRMRFGIEIIQAIRKVVGPDFPVAVRMNGNDFMQGGNGREELQTFAGALVAAGVDALNINVGWHEARVPQVTAGVPEGAYAYLARAMKALVDVPVMTGHRINTPQKARELIRNDMCDMVCLGRALIADPRLPLKAMEGRAKEIVHCVACGQGCFDHVFMVEEPVECLCNPKAGREKDRGPIKASRPLRVMVIGGGPAGMAAALSAAECGHSVSIYEAQSSLGGQLFIAGAPPGREEFRQLAGDLATQVGAANIAVFYDSAVDGALIDQVSPDAVILATGAAPITPPIPGVDLPHVVQAWDVLLDRVSTGKRVVVIGGGAVGLETALFLADKGTLSGDSLKFLLVNRAEAPAYLYELATKGVKEIILIEMISSVGKDVGLITRWTFLQDLARSGVKLLTGAKALEITPNGVKVDQNGQVSEIECETVVVAVGARPLNQLHEILEKKGIPCRVIGDAKNIGLAMHAIHQGFEAGRQLSN